MSSPHEKGWQIYIDQLMRRPDANPPKLDANDFGLNAIFPLDHHPANPGDARNKIRNPHGVAPPDKHEQEVLDRELDRDERAKSKYYQHFPKVDGATVDDRVTDAIGKLGATGVGSGEVRERAQRTLLDIGPAALKQLRAIRDRKDPDVRHQDPEVFDQARKLTNQLELRSILSEGAEAIAEKERLDVPFEKLPKDWPQGYDRLINFMDTHIDGEMLNRQLERLRKDPVWAESVELRDLEKLNEMRTRLRLQYAELLVQPGPNQDIPKAVGLLRTSLEKGLADPADPEFLRLANKAGAFNDPAFRRTFLEHDGDITDAGGKFKDAAEAEQFYKRRLAAIDEREKDVPEWRRNFADRRVRSQLVQRLKNALIDQGKLEEAQTLKGEEDNQPPLPPEPQQLNQQRRPRLD